MLPNKKKKKIKNKIKKKKKKKKDERIIMKNDSLNSFLMFLMIY